MDKTYSTNYPRCNYHKDCFAYFDGFCDCLTDTDFCGDDCPFYKSKEDLEVNQTIEYCF